MDRVQACVDRPSFCGERLFAVGRQEKEVLERIKIALLLWRVSDSVAESFLNDLKKEVFALPRPIGRETYLKKVGRLLAARAVLPTEREVFLECLAEELSDLPAERRVVFPEEKRKEEGGNDR